MARGRWTCNNCGFDHAKHVEHCEWCGVFPRFPLGLPRATAESASFKDFPFRPSKKVSSAAAPSVKAPVVKTPAPWAKPVAQPKKSTVAAPPPAKIPLTVADTAANTMKAEAALAKAKTDQAKAEQAAEEQSAKDQAKLSEEARSAEVSRLNAQLTFEEAYLTALKDQTGEYVEARRV